MRIGRELHGVGKILLGAETRREQIDHSGNDVDHGKGDEVDDDRAQEIWNDRRIAADERLADEVGYFRDCCEDRDVADQQIEQRVVLAFDHLPFRLRRQQDRFDPSEELAQVSCPHGDPLTLNHPAPLD